MNLVLTSFTPATASGGVPRWNRDLIAAFPEGTVKHYSWSDVIKTNNDVSLPEWNKANILNQWLIWSKKISKDDIILTDGFWGLGLEDFPNVVSICHGNWSHTTKSDVEKGIPPEFPQHNTVQVEYRKKHLARGGRLVAVSDFIADQCKLQWELEMPVINNGIDLNKFKPADYRVSRKRPVIVHGVTNSNKGYDHIKLLEKSLDADLVLLDDAARFFGVPKYRALAQADLVVIPSAHEGNSYFCLEALACDVPVVAYNVGLLYKAWNDQAPLGRLFSREARSPELFMNSVKYFLDSNRESLYLRPRQWVSQFSLENFQNQWKEYLKKEFDFGA